MNNSDLIRKDKVKGLFDDMLSKLSTDKAKETPIDKALNDAKLVLNDSKPQNQITQVLDSKTVELAKDAHKIAMSSYDKVNRIEKGFEAVEKNFLILTEAQKLVLSQFNDVKFDFNRTVNKTALDVEHLEARVKEFTDDLTTQFNDYKKRKDQTRKIEINNLVIDTEGKHANFSTLVSCAAISNIVGVYPYLFGEAGSGKSTAAYQLSQELKLSFGALSVGQETSKFEIFGYMSANGEYVPTLFYDIYKNGGVFLLDEIDSANGAVLTALNRAIAGERAAFGTDIVEKHQDFILIAAGNTQMTGADAKYSGREKQDGALIDRFNFIEWNLGEKEELSRIDKKYHKLAKTIQAARKIAKDKGIDTCISWRAINAAIHLSETEMQESDILDIVIYNKIETEEANLIKSIIKKS